MIPTTGYFEHGLIAKKSGVIDKMPTGELERFFAHKYVNTPSNARSNAINISEEEFKAISAIVNDNIVDAIRRIMENKAFENKCFLQELHDHGFSEKLSTILRDDCDAYTTFLDRKIIEKSLNTKNMKYNIAPAERGNRPFERAQLILIPPNIPQADVNTGEENTSNDSESKLIERCAKDCEVPDSQIRVTTKAVQCIFNDAKSSQPSLAKKVINSGRHTGLLVRHTGSWIQRIGNKSVLSIIPLPQKAPALWIDHYSEDETKLITFVKEHYGPWLRDDNTGVALNDLKELDVDLHANLVKYKKRRGEFPSDCRLPTVGERNTALVNMVASGEISAPRDRAEYQRLANAASKRGQSIAAY